MKTKNTILLIGKLLIAIGLLWPIPCGYIIKWFLELTPLESPIWNHSASASVLTYINSIPVFGYSHGYWWPILIVVTIGFLLCVFASAKKVGDEPYISTPLWLFMNLIKWCLIGVLCFHIVAALLISIVWIIQHFETTIPFVIGTSVLVLLFMLGMNYYKKNEDKTN